MAPAMSKIAYQRNVAYTKVLQSDSWKGPVNLQWGRISILFSSLLYL